jgi:hypothetical protein
VTLALAWAVLRANWRLAALAAAVAAALGTYAYVGHLRHAATHARAQAAAAIVQGKADLATVQAVDHYTHDLTVIHDRAERATDVVQAAAGATTPVPPDVLAGWIAGVRGLREPAGARADDHPAAQP